MLGAESGAQVEAFRKTIVTGTPRADGALTSGQGCQVRLFLTWKMRTIVLSLPILKGY